MKLKIVCSLLVFSLLLNSTFQSLVLNETSSWDEIIALFNKIDHLEQTELDKLGVLIQEIYSSKVKFNKIVKSGLENQLKEIDRIYQEMKNSTKKKEISVDDYKLKVKKEYDIFRSEKIGELKITEKNSNTHSYEPGTATYVPMSRMVIFKKKALTKDHFMYTDGLATCVGLIVVSKDDVVLLHSADEEGVDDLQLVKYIKSFEPDYVELEVRRAFVNYPLFVNEFLDFNNKMIKMKFPVLSIEYLKRLISLYERISHVFDHVDNKDLTKVYLANSLGKKSTYLPIIYQIVVDRLRGFNSSIQIFEDLKFSINLKNEDLAFKYVSPKDERNLLENMTEYNFEVYPYTKISKKFRKIIKL